MNDSEKLIELKANGAAIDRVMAEFRELSDRLSKIEENLEWIMSKHGYGWVGGPK